MEDSIHLAIDTGFQDILVTGDFNFNMLNVQSSYKIKDLCEQHASKQTINEPTHFTEHSSSLLDIILTTNENHLIFTGVGDPFLAQEIRYHCPVYGIFNFSKPKHKSFVRHIWSFEQGDYNLLREKALLTNWDNLYDADINKYAQNISNHIIMVAKECIPNRKTRIKPDEPAWINSEIRRLIKKRKRAFRKAKRTNLSGHWVKFKQLRNGVINLIRDSKQSHKDEIANTLRSGTLSSRDSWRTLKSVIAPNSKNFIPRLEKDGMLIVDDADKTRS